MRRPQAGRPGRRAFVLGKRRQNTIKTTTFSDGQGRMLLSGVVRPGRMHDQTAVRSEGIAEQFRHRSGVKAEVDSGYQGLAKEFPGQVSAPRKSPKDDACDGDVHGLQPVMWVGSVDNWLNVTPTKDSVSVSRTGNAYPDMEVVQYQRHQKPRWIAHDSMAHTSGYDAPDGLDGVLLKDRDHRTWVNGTCTKSC
ncbi:transposase family protein [Streptomyces cirratus]|uniref:transposase family protein n=1 Tax=Streptomyces cirratus TaxID=68187 RepID=UPI001E30620A